MHSPLPSAYPCATLPSRQMFFKKMLLHLKEWNTLSTGLGVREFEPSLILPLETRKCSYVSMSKTPNSKVELRPLSFTCLWLLSLCHILPRRKKAWIGSMYLAFLKQAEFDGFRLNLKHKLHITSEKAFSCSVRNGGRAEYASAPHAPVVCCRGVWCIAV